MKQKYTLSIADMEINVITDEPRESVEYIVGILDRKIRDIALKSKRCSKNEASLLCALDFCADKIKTKAQLEETEDKFEALTEKYDHLSEKLELVKKNNERLEKDRARLEAENAKLRAIIDDAKAGKDISASELTIDVEPEEPVVAEAVEEAVTPIVKKKNTVKSRVGSMFDLLTFSDI